MQSTHRINMHLLLLLLGVIMWDYKGMTTAQPHCDPLTEYVANDECCKMCGPGTRKSSVGTCLEPQCTECKESEYQDKYTSETKCELQPYCDKNSNFQDPVDRSKSKKSICMCKEGFHCSSEACLTCIPHTLCAPGRSAQPKGNHTHDTVCKKCPEGTFSNQTSWNSVCGKWTVCESGYQVQQSGTDKSDNICEEIPRKHTAVIIVCSVIGLILLCVLMLWLCRALVFGKGDTEGKICVESCWGDKGEKLREVVLTNPTDVGEEESMMPISQSSQDEGGAGLPEENVEDQPSQEVSSDVLFSENGKFVTQEMGKSSILSRQESQTQAFTD
ncbi:tumor necrosis factor receptor superfamily member 5 isoform X2 [Centropristis striata]|uniref:tumor necrosis factor receptor superfamily member 5 isoform X2 n=1 Tax=Centropristis striata TaxID=184440 RepID=UPI0027DEF03B|nr:tumor necrosis factor receptor superfamily member 5 isoform X2 [Centropristis striata]